jgi:DNA-binding transcriptional LysR family regulator
VAFILFDYKISFCFPCVIGKVCITFLRQVQVFFEDIMNTNFHLSSDECELLLAFEKAKSLEKLAALVNRDASAVSRRLQRVAQKSPVVEKIGNRWRLTPLGLQVNRWTEEALSQQAKALSQKTEIKLGASRIFAGKVLARHLPEFQNALNGFTISIVSLDAPLEPHLLNGTIDVAFTCGRPQDPVISHKRLVRERYVAVASKEFVSKYRPKGNVIYNLPFIAFRNTSGLYPFGQEVSKAKNTVAIFNDPVSLFEAVCNGFGWSILPYFAVKTNLEKLAVIPGIEIEAATYGVWWLRNRKSLQEVVGFAVEWLKMQDL